MSYAQIPEPEMSEPLSTEERDTLMDEIATRVVNRRMETPAILFLEMNKPISFIAGQSLIVMSPFLIPLFGQAGVRRYSQLLNNRDNVELLIRRIEDLADEKNRKRREN